VPDDDPSDPDGDPSVDNQEKGDPIAMATVTSAAGYRGEARTGTHRFVVDEGREVGGNDEGPNPYQLLLTALSHCTSATLRMYSERKGWELGEIRVRSLLMRVGEGATKKEHVERFIRFGTELTAEQKDRLLEIADRTPVTRTLLGGLAIHTTLG
jgi:putative redox protein